MKNRAYNKSYYDKQGHYGSDFPINQWYVDKMNTIPDYVTCGNKTSPEFLEILKKDGFELIHSTYYTNKKKTYIGNELYFKKDIGLIIKLAFSYVDVNNEDDYLSETFEHAIDSLEEESKTTFFFDFSTHCNVLTQNLGKTELYGLTGTFFFSDEKNAKPYVDKYNELSVEEKKEGRMYLICQNNQGFYLQGYDIKQKDFNVETHYGKSFLPKYNAIINSLNKKNNKGLFLLHGEPGTGKTSLIRHLATKIKKQVIFLPPYLVESLASPNFIPFLMGQANSVLVIEDAERVLMRRESGEGSPQGVSNILNLTDGIIGDCLGIQVLATFNIERTKIDEALLRKGRLSVEHEFKKLSKDEANDLFIELGKEPLATEPMSLTDIYNYEENNFHEKQERKPIGFTNRY